MLNESSMNIFLYSINTGQVAYICNVTLCLPMRLLTQEFLDYISIFAIQGVHKLRQRTFEPLLKKLAHDICIAI